MVGISSDHDWLGSHSFFMLFLKKIFMKYRTCPQCGITNFYLKDNSGNMLLVKISADGKIIPKNPDANLNNFDINIIYCLGCSWEGTIDELV